MFCRLFDTLVVTINGLHSYVHHADTICGDSFNVTVTNCDGVFKYLRRTGPHPTVSGPTGIFFGRSQWSATVKSR